MNNGIQSYVNSMNTNRINYKDKLNTNIEVDLINNQQNKEKNISEISKSDTIEIRQSNDLVINTKKAYDAFREACKETGSTKWNGYIADDMSGDYLIICDYMKLKGYKVPNLFYNGDMKDLKNNNDFVGFIDTIENFVKTNPKLKDNYPTKFFEFTKLYKEKLIQYGCQ
ncbi:hypothetical protein SAMN04487886_102533 [Clostridium sp. DSM 8431]|uniref:hypothetical protein n=1 Tax=Clostridium sp. DSM 8431 TaxID=1761781 RepID=UPI0008F2DC83|nr:hypothetical protein [Clostridium sp. DSM 8431]SFU42973.1 hypothetical protein SAMN04487886_102533 [Clostridium sp. DSM 8431]